MEPIILLDLDTHDANALVLEPAFNYDNVFQRNLGVYKFEIGVTKYRMTHMSRPSNVLQPKLGCNDWNPTVNNTLRPWEITSVEYEVMGEQCPDEFDRGCLRNLKNASDELNRVGGLNNPEINAIETAMAMTLRLAIRDSIFKVAWFGDVNFSTKVSAGAVDISAMPIKEQTKLVEMLEHHNGWWSEIQARVGQSGEYVKVRYVDTNDGSGAGNATNPANIADYLRELRMASHPILQFWNLDRPKSEWPVYLLQRGIFDALWRYYQSLGTEIAHQFLIDGKVVENALMFDGYVCLLMPEWDMFDFETGKMAPGGQSLTQRAIFTAPENLCGIAHTNTIDGLPDSALVIQASPLIKDKGKKWQYASLGMGFGIAQPILMTVGYNSSETYT